MARFTGGWVKKHRRIQNNWIGRDPIANSVFDTLLWWAYPSDRETLVDGKRTMIRRGQAVTSATEIAAYWGVDRKTVQRKLELMAEDGVITQQTSHKGRIVTLCNYEKYQGEQEDDCPTDVPPSTRQIGRQSTRQIGHRVKKARTQEIKKEKDTPSAPDMKLAQDWAAHTSSRAPHLKPDPTKYAQAIVKAKKATGLTDQQLEETLAWIKASSFWAANALSPAGLLTVGKNGLRKIDTIRAQMQEAQPAPVRSTRELFNLVKKEEASGT